MKKQRDIVVTIAHVRRCARRRERLIAKKRERMYGMPANSHPIPAWQARLLLRYAADWSAAHREPGQHASGPLTRSYQAVLAALLSFANNKTGNCFPSYVAIAQRARCAESTVALAIVALEHAGMIHVTNRITRDKLGKVIRTSNAYTFRPVAPNPDYQRGVQFHKDSKYTTPSVAPQVIHKVTVLDPRDGLDAALIALGRAMSVEAVAAPVR